MGKPNEFGFFVADNDHSACCAMRDLDPVLHLTTADWRLIVAAFDALDERTIEDTSADAAVAAAHQVIGFYNAQARSELRLQGRPMPGYLG